MVQYILIKAYPKSPEIGNIIRVDDIEMDFFDKWSEYWKQIHCNICVGTKFVAKGVEFEIIDIKSESITVERENSKRKYIIDIDDANFKFSYNVWKKC